MECIAVIPARGGSKRLPRKNLYPVLGVPMIGWVISACRRSEHIGAVYVSTEDKEIAQVSQEWGATVIERPAELAGDQVFKQTVIEHAVETLLGQEIPIDVVISAQPNSPEVTARDLDAAIEKFLAHDLWELFSVDPQLLQNGAFRIMRRETVFLKALSVYCGVFVTDYSDIHTIEDVARVESRLRGQPLPTPRGA
jgi:CMP-N-acetylneuraminic acid synthetase